MINILHLSDLHFGPHSHFPFPTDELEAIRLGEEFHRALIATGMNEKINVVIVTGDITEAARVPEFKTAHAFLSAFTYKFDRVVFVPGNHDVSWFRCREVAVLQDEHGFDDDEMRRRLDEVKLRHYDDFRRSLDGTSELLARGARLYRFSDLRLSVAALNSCEAESHRPEDHHGFVSRQQAQAVLDAWSSDEDRGYLRIVALHHHPGPRPRHDAAAWRQSLESEGALKPFEAVHYENDAAACDGIQHLETIVRDAHVQLVLHGHHHARDEQSFKWANGGRAQVLSAGSPALHAGRLPRDEPAAIRVIRLAPEPPRIEARSFVFTGWRPTRWPSTPVEGSFVLHPAAEDEYRQRLYLPPATATADDTERAGADRAVQAYRQRMRPLFSRWDLDDMDLDDMDLDDMYVPLRFADEMARGKTRPAKPIGPDDLLERWRPLLIRGPKGSGKTTWMRFTFRRLLEMPRALPFRIGDAEELEAVLADSEGPRPILFADDWHKLGETAQSRVLELMNDCPRLLVVASSRLYGEGTSWSPHFEILVVQPLGDEEIRALGQRFFARGHGADEPAARRPIGPCEKAFQSSKEARDLARTPIFLTKLLAIGQSRPLPDQRHQLYEICIEHLLAALPKEEGEWRPDDSVERLRLVAELAYRLRREYSDLRRTRERDKMETLLPPDWSPQQRKGFLKWLSGSAAIFVDQKAGELSFAHLSFEEYLTARHLHATHLGAQRLQTFTELFENTHWWKILVLWSAISEHDHHEPLDDILEFLRNKGHDGLVLSGMIFADGLGPDADFVKWVDRYLDFFERKSVFLFEKCARAWAASRQEKRIELFQEETIRRAADARWIPWSRLADISLLAFERELSPPPGKTLARDLFAGLDGKASTSRAVAAGRLLGGAHAIWPIDPWQVGLLQLWPGRRRIASLRLQALMVCGAEKPELDRVMPFLLRQPTWDAEARGFALDFAHELADSTLGIEDFYFTPDFASDWARDFARDFACDSDNYSTRDWIEDLADDWFRNFARHSGRELARLFVHDLARCYYVGWARNWAHDWKIEESSALTSFNIFDFMSFGRAGARAQMSVTKIPEDLAEGHLLRAACRLSLHPDDDPSAFHTALETHASSLDPLWGTLARHLARRSTDADRALLKDLARHPEKREPPLSWGLQFIVRGDVMDDDGTVTTLDELCDEHGLPHLPYLEDMPDEIEVPDEKYDKRRYQDGMGD